MGILGGILGYFFGILRVFLGVSSGSPGFRAGGYFFRHFFVEIPGRAISGSVAGRGILNIGGGFLNFWNPCKPTRVPPSVGAKASSFELPHF